MAKSELYVAILELCIFSVRSSAVHFFALQETARFRKAKMISMPARFATAQQRAMAMRNSRRARFPVWRVKRFEDVAHIEAMTPEEYDRELYYLKHPDEYGGDYNVFCDRILEFGYLPDHADRIFVAKYR